MLLNWRWRLFIKIKICLSKNEILKHLKYKYSFKKFKIWNYFCSLFSYIIKNQIYLIIIYHIIFTIKLREVFSFCRKAMRSLISFNICNTFRYISLIIRYSYHIIKQMVSFINIEIWIFYIIHIILKSISRNKSSIAWNKSSCRFSSSKTYFIIWTMYFWLIM